MIDTWLAFVNLCRKMIRGKLATAGTLRKLVDIAVLLEDKTLDELSEETQKAVIKGVLKG